MASDPFDDLLDLENDYYQEGYNAGVSDSTYAGMIEGKVFGIEKGYEKALDLGKLHGRALLWHGRFQAVHPEEPPQSAISSPSAESRLGGIIRTLPQMPNSSRLQRHVESLHATSEASTIAKDNSDEAVTEFDDRIAKAKAKAKVVANIAGESLNPTSTSNAGIEDATGLQARH
ncbi:hypothetical protein A1O7_02381 [Cladophialophora yegresii CBS 114405]|uniref:Essential protein Yae1 N-terminal domain-containing protein n=1 Tax=Cladophialophora yegresii CBS 114405 TaxID=1182544 RepID=W9WUH8_9EURO|nr:uncharacterized protein A1O7_02381 [Cladophialophora yegresii CBS 114405]EXJ61949.1 hypothetical protein A1O7_02381 [Cladophialophora yegresii CBS 114405]